MAEINTQSIQAINMRDVTLCDTLNKALETGLCTLVVNARSLRVPIRKMESMGNGWIDCTIAVEEGETEDDAKISVKNYSCFTLYFGSSRKEIKLL